MEQSEFNDQLVRGLTHKLNNILSLFHGYISMLLENKNLDSGARDGLARIKEGARAASHLMDRTQALARPSSVVWRQISPAKFLLTARPTLEAFCDRGVKLEVRCSEDLPPFWVDVSRLRTALIEVVRNACESSVDGGTVLIEVDKGTGGSNAPRSGVQPTQWLSISVTNSGDDIAPEVAGRIFQPFFSTKTKQNALGLGLTVASGLIQQLGGVIRFASENGRTTFRLLLPLRVEGF